MAKICTRFAPSPTGSLHIGGLRTALYSLALAKHNKGDFILRIEDTDKKREVAGGVNQIKKILKTFGLDWDEFYMQSQRLELYQDAAKKLVKEGHAFYCQCQAKNAKKQGYSKILRDPCRDKNLKSGAIKLLVPENEIVTYKDFVLDKAISWNTNQVADATLLKSDGFPTYHLAVVVDDSQMKITHALRGHDWLPSTPIHLLVYKYLGYDRPQIGHLTDILDPDGGKLSKRKASLSCEALLKQGYLAEAILNFVMLLGWAPKDNRELFSLDEFVKAFDIKGLQKANPIFNRQKLDWFNGEYIRKLSLESLNSKLKNPCPQLLRPPDTQSLRAGSSASRRENLKFASLPERKQLEITKLVQDRIKTLKDFEQLAGFFFERKKVDKKLFGKNSQKHLQAAYQAIGKLKTFNLGSLNQSLIKAISKQNFKTGDFFMDLRIAITASKFTPPINESIIILGQKETLVRIKKAISN
jgi:glutamyl-tRNA synthetase